MATDSFPYQKSFAIYLNNQSLSHVTVASYQSSINNFFAFLRANRSEALSDGVKSINETDVRAYFDYLQQQRQITLGSYNKTLAQINRYFTYLFTHHLSHHLPTLPLHGKQVATKDEIHFDWLSKISDILADSNIHYYTRMVFLLLANGYTVNEFLQPGFYHLYQQMPTHFDNEETFRQQYQSFIAPLQKKQNSSDIFLKQRLDLSHPQLTNPALHKYLKSDQDYFGFNISPAKLHQSYVCYQLKQLRGQSDQEIEKALGLDPQSLLYFKKLLLQYGL